MTDLEQDCAGIDSWHPNRRTGATWRQRMGWRLDQVSAVSWYCIIMGSMVAFALLAYEIGGK